jgi:cell wall-associated NlpC family hydrolase
VPSYRPRAAAHKVRVLVLVVSLVAGALAALSGAAAHARPSLQRSIAQVSALLDRLSRQNEMLDERYNTAVAAAASQQKAARAAAQAARAAAHAAAVVREHLSMTAAQRYEAGSLDSTSLLLTSNNPQAYLNDLSSMDYLSSQLATLATQARTSAAHARTAAAHAAQEASSAQAKVRTVRSQQAVLQSRTDHFTTVLAGLSAEQQRRYEHAREVALAKAQAIARAQARAAARAPKSPPAATPVRPTPVVPVPPTNNPVNVQRAIDYAEAQVGKSYSYGASGPDSFDCSGLTMASWARGGVYLPHSAAAQYNVGQHVPYDQLQPGDLIFLYQPIGHVEIYVGKDLAVSAADPALGVVYVHPSSDMSDYVGATRPQG